MGWTGPRSRRERIGALGLPDGHGAPPGSAQAEAPADARVTSRATNAAFARLVGHRVPSAIHELLVHLLREHPEVVAALLPPSLADAAYTLVPAPGTVTELNPAELRADVVLRGVDPTTGATLQALIVEVQLRIDPDKRFTWPLYAAGLRARLRCPVTLVIVTPDASVARWAAKPIAMDPLGSALCPYVVGPAQVPTVCDVATARWSPELAVVSMVAHARSPRGLAVARALLEATADLDESRARLYTDVVFAVLDGAARTALEIEMQIDGYEYQSEFARRFLAKGREEGREEGRVAALAEVVIEILAARGMVVDETSRARIMNCRDADTLHAWAVAAVTAPDLATLLG